jgi:hypothetical protein
MKSRWITIALLISAAFNLTFLGAVGYRLWSKHSRHEKVERIFINRPGMEEEPSFRIARKHMEELRDRMNPKIAEIRKQLFEERKGLSELMMADKPDTSRINAAVGRIGNLQVRIEKEIIEEMLREEPSQGGRIRRPMMRLFHERLGGMPEPGPGMMGEPGMMPPPPPEFRENDSIPDFRPDR